MALDGPVRLAITGIGGYAREITNLILEHGSGCDPEARVVAVCDPAVASHATRVAELKARDIEVFAAYEEMLAAKPRIGIEGVWLPVPIPLHLPFAAQALDAGLAVMVEKPAAGTLDELDAMIAERDRHGLPVLVGFQDVYDRTTLPLKQRLLAGEFGTIEDATLYACWPRSDHYFGRANWAGRIQTNGSWVLDSPAQNALAHYVNIVLFLLGPTEEASATIERIEVELYRAATIENYDTISARLHLAGGTRFLVLLTHACTHAGQPITVLHGEGATITRVPNTITIESPAGTETIERSRMRTDMLQRFARVIRGLPDDGVPLATLDSAREHTRFISATSEFAPIHDVPDDAIESFATAEQGSVQAIRGIEEVFPVCAERRQMLHESGLLGFTSPPTVADLRSYSRFGGPHAYATRPATSTT